MSQAQLAAKTGLSPRTIFTYEQENNKITIENLQIIAKALDVDWFEILRQEFNINPQQQNFETVLANENTIEYFPQMFSDFLKTKEFTNAVNSILDKREVERMGEKLLSDIDDKVRKAEKIESERQKKKEG